MIELLTIAGAFWYAMRKLRAYQFEQAYLKALGRQIAEDK